MTTTRKPVQTVNRPVAKYLQILSAIDSRMARSLAQAECSPAWAERIIIMQRQAADLAELARWAAGVEE